FATSKVFAISVARVNAVPRGPGGASARTVPPRQPTAGIPWRRSLTGVPELPGSRLPSAVVPHGGHHRVAFPDGADHHALVVEQRRDQPVVEAQAPLALI